MTGPFELDSHPTDPDLIGPELSPEYSFSGLAGLHIDLDIYIDDRVWVGVHTFKVIAYHESLKYPGKQYIVEESNELQITVIDTCETTAI